MPAPPPPTMPKAQWPHKRPFDYEWSTRQITGPAPASEDTGPAGPFAPYLVSSTEGVTKIAISDGTLVTKVSDGTEQAITGLGDEITLADDTVVYLEVTLLDFVVQDAEVMTGNVWPDPVTMSGGGQIAARVVLGSVFSGSLPSGADGIQFVYNDATYHFKRFQATNLFMALMTEDGEARMYPLAITV